MAVIKIVPMPGPQGEPGTGGGSGELVIPVNIKDSNGDNFITLTRTSTGTARIGTPQDDLSLRSARDITLFAGDDGPGNVYIGWGDAVYTPDSPNRVATIGDIQEAGTADFVFTNVDETNSSITVTGDKELTIQSGASEDLNVRAGDDLWLTADDEIKLQSGDDVEIRSESSTSILTNFVDLENDEYEWQFGSQGYLTLPGGGEIINPPNSSGDGSGYSTIVLDPDNTLESDQYIIIDPTGPNHIHIRSGGVQDYSNAELIVGGERAHVKVVDSGGYVEIQSKKEDPNWTYPNIDPTGGVVYIIDSEVAEPDLDDFMIVDGIKYVITSVNRNEEFGVTSYETTPSFTFNYNENYTFTRDNGNYTWTFGAVDDQPVLVLPSEQPIIINPLVPGDITLSAYNGVKLSFADTEGAGLEFPDDSVQTTAFIGGATGSFVSQDGKTITVTNGIITSIEVI